jgi:hypothetical protein
MPPSLARRSKQCHTAVRGSCPAPSLPQAQPSHRSAKGSSRRGRSMQAEAMYLRRVADWATDRAASDIMLRRLTIKTGMRRSSPSALCRRKDCRCAWLLGPSAGSSSGPGTIRTPPRAHTAAVSDEACKARPRPEGQGGPSVRVGYRISVRQRLAKALHFVAIGLSLSSSRTPSIRAPFRGDEHVVDGIVSRAKREGNGTRGRGCGAYNRVRVGRSGAFSAGMRERQQIGLQSETGSASKPAWDVSTHEEGKEGDATLRDAALNVGWPSQGLPVSTPAHFAAPNGHTPDSLASLEISE